MSVETKVSLGKGGITFWTLSEFSDREQLKAGFAGLGFAALAPERRPATAILKSSLEGVFGNSRTLIRPLATRNGFAVIREERGVDENKYEGQLTVVVADDESLRFSRTDSETEEVKSEFAKQRDLVGSSQLATSLVAVCKALTGVSLRPSGAIYWLTGSQLDAWRSMTKVVEGASVGASPSSVYLVEHEVNDEAVKAVSDAITNDIAVSASKLTDEITAGDLGLRALVGKKAAATALETKVTLYESILAKSLDSLRHTISEARFAADAAVLAISAASAIGAR